MRKDTISRKQKEILNYLKKEILDRGFPPSVREICEAVNLKSTSTVHSHLASLERNGFIHRDAAKPRAIEILDPDFQKDRLQQRGLTDSEASPSSEIAQIPVVGHVAAGEPLLAVEQIEDYFPMPVDRLPNRQTFFLKIEGESMIEAGILDGDYVLVMQQNAAENGDMVVALIDDSATVKTYYKEKDHVRLQPQNKNMAPILIPFTRDLHILGVVIGVFRFFR